MMDIEKVEREYDRYWDCEEIDVDLANKLVYYIPQFLNEIKRLRKALKCYADPNNYIAECGAKSEVLEDAGYMARKALGDD